MQYNSQCLPIHSTKCFCAFLSIFDFRVAFPLHALVVGVHLSGAILLVKSCKFYCLASSRVSVSMTCSQHSCNRVQGEAWTLSNQSCYFKMIIIIIRHRMKLKHAFGLQNGHSLQMALCLATFNPHCLHCFTLLPIRRCSSLFCIHEFRRLVLFGCVCGDWATVAYCEIGWIALHQFCAEYICVCWQALHTILCIIFVHCSCCRCNNVHIYCI